MTRTIRNFRLTSRAAALAGTALATLFAVSAAEAASLVALTNDNTIQLFSTTDRKVTATMQVKGLTAPLAGFDVRPADGMLYGLQRDGQIVTIDVKSGQATPKARLNQPLPAASVHLTVDFNPAADRLRVVGADGTNLRINVDDGATTVDGKLRYADADANRAVSPRVMAGAYSNKFKGTQATALYEIEVNAGALVRQAPPNDGILSTLGPIGAKPEMVAFAIEADGKGGNTGWLVLGDALSTIDIGNGQTRALGKVAGLKGKVRDIAVLPAM